MTEYNDMLIVVCSLIRKKNPLESILPLLFEQMLTERHAFNSISCKIKEPFSLNVFWFDKCLSSCEAPATYKHKSIRARQQKYYVS